MRTRTQLWLWTAMLLTMLAGCTPSDSSGVNEEPGPLGLAKIPWEGGPDYWSQFPKAAAAGWTDPSFFPIVVWYNGVSSQAEIDFDKDLGINTYIGMHDTFDSALLDQNEMYWIGGALNETFTEETPSWVGYILDDEVDGRFPPTEGRAHLANIAADVPEGLFKYANYTYMVLESDLAASDSEKYVNGFTDVVSVDKYWYTVITCSKQPYRDVSVVPVEQQSCRTSSSYGKTMESLRVRDSVDGKLQPLWQFVENMGGTDQEDLFGAYIDPGQLKGAVMNSLIHEARGIVYFNQSLAGPCKGGNVFRMAQVTANYCGAAQVDAAREVNQQIKKLAPVLNTQSLDFETANDVDTMLKVYDGHAYLFTMLEAGAAPGTHAITVPAGVSGDEVEVLFEDRALPLTGGEFIDTFDQEFTYHIYKVKL